MSARRADRDSVTGRNLTTAAVPCRTSAGPGLPRARRGHGILAKPLTPMWRELHHLYNGSSGTFLPVKEGNDAMATVKFDQATRIYPGNDSPSVDRLDIDVADGEFLVLVGPSGCGKSTSLRMLAGLEEVNGGKIWIGDRDVTDLSPKDRDVAMVFQNYALYPHMTVADNMGFALKIAGVDKSEIRKRVAEAAQILDLSRLPRAQAEGPLRWPAPARRHGPGDRPLPPGVPHGRAAVEPRRQAARADPHPDRLSPAPTRRHHGLRHPRPDRGHDDGRPHRPAQGRHPPAVRHPARDVRPAEQRVRRRLHRLPGHEPRLGAGHRGRRAVRQPPPARSTASCSARSATRSSWACAPRTSRSRPTRTASS